MGSIDATASRHSVAPTTVSPRGVPPAPGQQVAVGRQQEHQRQDGDQQLTAQQGGDPGRDRRRGRPARAVGLLHPVGVRLGQQRHAIRQRPRRTGASRSGAGRSGRRSARPSAPTRRPRRGRRGSRARRPPSRTAAAPPARRRRRRRTTTTAVNAGRAPGDRGRASVHSRHRRRRPGARRGTRVPRPGTESVSERAPHATRPGRGGWPAPRPRSPTRGRTRVPLSSTVSASASAASAQVDRRSRGTGVLDGVLERPPGMRSTPRPRCSRRTGRCRRP